jgi:transposase
MARFDLSERQMVDHFSGALAAEGKKNGRPRPDDRKVLNGIFFVLRSGTP